MVVSVNYSSWYVCWTNVERWHRFCWERSLLRYPGNPKYPRSLRCIGKPNHICNPDHIGYPNHIGIWVGNPNHICNPDHIGNSNHIVIRITLVIWITLEIRGILVIWSVMVILVISSYPSYRGIIGILWIAVYFGLPQYHSIIPHHRSPFISVCHSITASFHITDRSLFRLVAISWHHSLSHIVIYSVCQRIMASFAHQIFVYVC